MIKKILLIISLMLANGILFSQNSLNDADDFYNQKNYGSALKIYLQYEESDLNSNRLFKLGYSYYGTSQYCKAKQIFEKSIQKFNNSEPAVTLGYIYEKGLCGSNKIDLKKAYEYYSLASDLGNSEGTYNLAVFYREGFYVRKDLCKAQDLYYKASQQGSINGKIGYAISLNKGYCDLTSHKKAFELLLEIDENGDGVKASYYSTLGWLYETGKGGILDISKAKYYFQKGCKLFGDEYSCDKLNQ